MWSPKVLTLNAPSLSRIGRMSLVELILNLKMEGILHGRICYKDGGNPAARHGGSGA